MAVKVRKNAQGKVTSHRVVWRLNGARDGAWQGVSLGPTRGHKAQAQGLDAMVRGLGYRVTDDAPEVVAYLGRAPLAEAEPEADDLTVRQVIERYLARPSIKPATATRYRPTLDKLGPLGDVPVSQLDRHEHINPWFKALEAKGYAPNTRALAKAVVKGALADHDERTRSLFRDVKFKQSHKVRLTDPHALTDEQVRDLIANAGGSVLGLMVRVAVETGLRKRELLGLTAADIDLTPGVAEIHVRAQLADEASATRRNGFVRAELKHASHDRRVPISDDLADALGLVAGLDADEPIFSQPSKQWWADGKAWWLVAAFDLAVRTLIDSTPSVPNDVSWHDMRHTAGMRWLRGNPAAGVEPLQLGVVSMLLGHENIGITHSTYSHWTNADAAAIRTAGLTL